jgi:preprotein translocase subunit SecF
MALPIIKNRKLWFTISGALIAASVVVLIVWPPKFGVDFTGGSLLEAKFSGPRADVVAVREGVGELGYKDVTVQPVGDSSLLIKLPHLDEKAHQELLKGLHGKFGDFTEERFEAIGPTVGAELRSKALWSVVLVLCGIALYVAYAFRKVSRPVQSWKYGLVTLLVALTHDVLLPVAALGVLGHLLDVELNSGIVAAVLTILGFSVHDTIVVFDRIRENLLKTGGTFEEAVERSVNETLSRSINTSFTALLPLIAIVMFGGETIKFFAVTLIIGLVAGTYSSIFLAAPLLVVFERWGKRRA